jgi:hypothetical protein
MTKPFRLNCIVLCSDKETHRTRPRDLCFGGSALDEREDESPKLSSVVTGTAPFAVPPPRKTAARFSDAHGSLPFGFLPGLNGGGQLGHRALIWSPDDRIRGWQRKEFQEIDASLDVS